MKQGLKISNFIYMFIAFIFFFLLSSSRVGAMYDVGANKIVNYKVDRNKDEVSLGINYQYGLKDIEVYICKESNENCSQDDFITKYVDNSYLINDTDSVKLYENRYSAVTEGTRLKEYGDTNQNLYTIIIKASFCLSRTMDQKECANWSDSVEVVDEKFDINTGITHNPKLDGVIFQVLDIVNTIVIPVLWVILFALLLVRGIMLAVDIVKSSDEPEVRSRKISGLVWLVIGVFVGYAVTIGASIIMDLYGIGGLFS